MILRGIKRYFKRLKKEAEFRKRRKISDYRATSMAVRLVLSGALIPCRRGVSMIGRAK